LKRRYEDSKPPLSVFEVVSERNKNRFSTRAIVCTKKRGVRYVMLLERTDNIYNFTEKFTNRFKQ